MVPISKVQRRERVGLRSVYPGSVRPRAAPLACRRTRLRIRAGESQGKVRGRPTAEIMASKEMLRRELQPVVDEQKRHPAVVGLHFQNGKRRPFGPAQHPASSWRTERSWRQDWRRARELQGEERVTALGDAIKPYLQEADKSVDPTTGRRLREIWRYFRYSWSIPQVPTPGRQLLYLVRDGAHPAHPVIGIAALNNCPLEMGKNRERYIGWHFRGDRRTIQRRRREGQGSAGRRSAMA